MSIYHDSNTNMFCLRTASGLYQIKTDTLGYLRHIYYGRDTGKVDNSYILKLFDLGFSGNPYEVRKERDQSTDLIPMEYSSKGNGDNRVPAVVIRNADGSLSSDFRYVSHEITNGKYTLNGLPSVYDNGGECETLIVTLKDSTSSVLLKLYYGVFEKLDVITRCAVFINTGSTPVTLEKAASACLDFPYGEKELIHFYGRHLLERQPERVPLGHFVTSIGEDRGASSHQHNPFVILCDKDTTEDYGDCYGMMLVYSGSFLAEAERTQTDGVRLVMGIHPGNFCWKILPGESFETPEVILSYASGLAALSHNYHDVIRRNICRGPYRDNPRPVLINSWEAAYFDIDPERAAGLACQAAELGIELFVLDDGWFSNRHDDNAGLGDWFVNQEKFPQGLNGLISEVKKTGMKFGIWIEPEMVNEDSDLYRAHPDWALTIPGRRPVMARNQLVLDLSRRDVRDYLFESFSKLLDENDISYVKWDMNRNLTDVYTRVLPPERQGEVLHRYVLGVYELLDRLETAFPEVLFEGCAGGGGRFDAGMMYYTPQIWCSDDTDPVERLKIQNGSSYGYPLSVISAHVSASPNHQTGRNTELYTRNVAASTGAYGYELDLAFLSEDEKHQIKEQIIRYKKDEAVYRCGDYYRLSESDDHRFSAWMSVSKDGSNAIVSVVQTDAMLCPPRIHIRLKGLDDNAMYEIEEDRAVHSGAALMHAGYTFEELHGNYPAIQLHLKRI